MLKIKNEKQFGETALKDTANYEEYSHKSNKNKLQYRQSLNISIREFATTLHENIVYEWRIDERKTQT